MKKYFIFIALAVATTFVSCSKTTDALGLDSIYNIVKTGKWTVLNKETYALNSSTPLTKDSLLKNGEYAEFRSDDKVHLLNSSKVEFGTKSYALTDTKTMILDGVEFKIQENFVSTIKQMTLINESAIGKTVYIFKR